MGRLVQIARNACRRPIREGRETQGVVRLPPDGEYLYFTWEERLGDIWVMDVVTDESE